jgi:hypothetical protein
MMLSLSRRAILASLPVQSQQEMLFEALRDFVAKYQAEHAFRR